METKVWYNCVNNGDGSVSVEFCKTRALVELLEEIEIEREYGWGDSSIGCLVIKHDGDIAPQKLVTKESILSELQEAIDEGWDEGWEKDFIPKLEALDE